MHQRCCLMLPPALMMSVLMIDCQAIFNGYKTIETDDGATHTHHRLRERSQFNLTPIYCLDGGGGPLTWLTWDAQALR